MHTLRSLPLAAMVAALALAITALAACTSTYHPEYHPVTVTSYEQHVSNGATLGVPGAPPQAGPVLSAPAPQPPPPPPPWSAWPSE